jgi:von Willebrand factor A domain-containing protein 7
MMIRMCTPVLTVALAVFAAVASCADRSYAGDGAAHEQQNRTRKFGPGECGPVDPTYIHLANETGGQPFFLNPSEVGKAFHYVRESSGGQTETLLWAMGTFAPESPQEFIVPVDSTVRRVTFSMSVETSGSDFIVTDPAGGAVAATDSRTDITVLNCGRIVTVDAPTPGAWRLRASGVGRFWLTTHARTELSFVTAEFVRPGGRPGHEGLFRIHGQPLAGVPATLRAVVSREHVASLAFDLVSQHGDEIRGVRLKADATHDDAEFVATFDLPSQPFRVRVTGIDAAGRRYQRVFQTLFHGETVEVTPAMSTIDDVAPGSSSAAAFTVHNVGPAGAFRIMAADGRRMIGRFEPTTLTLESGAVATVTVWINVPADAKPGTGADITVTAVSESQPPTTNGATLHLEIKN